MARVMWGGIAAIAVLSVGVAGAQTPDRSGSNGRQLAELQEAMRLKESRYQIGQMERLLEGAVEHGATVIRDRLRALMPSDMLLTENARARGFRLDGYGVFFDVQVPSLEGTLPWSFYTLDQNNLGIDSALRTVRTFVEASAGNDVNVQQALKRIELQVAPVGVSTPSVSGDPRAVAVSGQATPDDPHATAARMPASIADINEDYRSEIRDALIDAMLDHSRGLSIPAAEHLTLAARGSDDRPRLAPADTESRTVVISVRGADLSLFLGGQITRDEARKRVEMRVF